MRIMIAILISFISGIMFSSCRTWYTVQAMSLDTGEIVTFDREYRDFSMVILSTSSEYWLPEFYVVTEDDNRDCYLIRYSVDGYKLEKIKLPISIERLWFVLVTECVFIPESSKFFYPVKSESAEKTGKSGDNSQSVYSYKVGEKEPKKILSLEPGEEISSINTVTQEIVIVFTFNFEEGKNYYYSIETETGNVISKIQCRSGSSYLGINAENKTVLIREFIGDGPLSRQNLYDACTGKFLSCIPVSFLHPYGFLFYEDRIIYEDSLGISIANADGSSQPSLLVPFDKSKDTGIEILAVVSENVLLYNLYDKRRFRDSFFILYDIEKREEIKRIKCPCDTYNIHVVDHYVIWET